MPTAAELLDAYVGESGAEPANLDWFHALIRYKEAAATALLIKRAIKNSGDTFSGTWETTIPACTAECIRILEDFEPVS
jgi:hypothetical protein